MLRHSLDAFPKSPAEGVDVVVPNNNGALDAATAGLAPKYNIFVNK